jgi:transcription antitermination factor NusG
MADSASSFPTLVEKWAALRTAARWEKKLAGILAAVGVPVFLPMLTRVTTSHGKRRTSQIPVFPGFVFCSEVDFLDSKRIPANTRSQVAQVLRPSDPVRLLNELRGIADLLTERELVQEHLGDPANEVLRVVGEPLAGHEGKVVQVKPDRWVLVVEVSLLGSKLEAEVDERMVKKVVKPSSAGEASS